MKKIKCADCGGSASTNMYYDLHGNAICKTCAPIYIECPQTGIKLHKSEAIEFDGKFYHQSARESWLECSLSGNRTPFVAKHTVLTSDMDEEKIIACSREIQKHYAKCSKTNMLFKKEDGVDVDGTLFSKLGAAILANPIGTYHNDGRNNLTFMVSDKEKEEYAGDSLLPDGRKKRFFGVEIEAYVPRKFHKSEEYVKNISRYFACESQKILNKESVHARMEWDGSVDKGYETIFMPMTKEYMREYKMSRRIWDIQKLGMYSFETRSCGLHVHVTKASLKPLQWWKINAFFAKCKKRIIALSGRKEEQLKQWAFIESEAQFLTKAENQPRKHTSSPTTNNPERGDKYTAINFKNSKTVEFRLFNGTLNGDRFMNTINFIDALLDFSKDCGYSFFINSKPYEMWKAFMNYFKTKYPKSHKYIHQYVENEIKQGIED